jgi:ferric-chelate reductase
VHNCDGGWTAGQHVRLRVFFDGRLFEAHPLTICTAPPTTSCVSTRTLTLAARVRGDWTRALNAYAQAEQSRLSLALGAEKSHCDSQAPQGVPVQVMFDGAYGGCSIDLGAYDTVLLLAGGSGATFTLGLLDNLVGRVARHGRARGERTRRVEFAWCVRSFACIAWFAPMLADIARSAAQTGSGIDLHVSVFVTCLCDPEAVPPIPNCDVSVYRPSVGALLRELVTPPPSSAALAGAAQEKLDIARVESNGAASSVEEDLPKTLAARLRWVGLGGGVGVCASGPESLIRETQNAVARLGATRGVELGGIGLHTELFAL